MSKTRTQASKIGATNARKRTKTPFRTTDSEPKRVRMSVDPSHHETLCGLTDPFCPHAKDAKLPDMGAGNTFTEQIRFVGTVTTNSEGNAAVCFAPKCNRPVLPAITSSTWPAGSIPWESAWENSVESLADDNAQDYRVTTCGVRLVSLLSSVDSKGAVALAAGTSTAISDVDPNSPDAFTDYDLHAIGPSSEWHMVGSPMGNGATDFQKVGYFRAPSVEAPPGWNALYVIVSGGPANTPILRYEYVLNIEFRFKTEGVGSSLHKLASPQPVYNPQMLVARNEVQSNVQHVIKGAKQAATAHLKSEAKKALTKHLLPFLAKKGTQLLA